MYGMYTAVYNVHVHNVICTMDTAYSVHCTVYIVQCTLYSVHCTVYIVYSVHPVVHIDVLMYVRLASLPVLIHVYAVTIVQYTMIKLALLFHGVM